MTPLSPVGWVVLDAKGGAALFLERPAADQFATRVHGTVDALYSGAQLVVLMDAAAARIAKE